jgi:hypothetical protein
MGGGQHAKPPLETGQSFLKTSQHEAAGYGLYSYLLLGSAHSETMRERYLNTIAAFLSLPKITNLELPGTPPLGGTSFQPAMGLPRSQLNIAYIPVDDALSAQDGQLAKAVLEHYDYGRACLLLRSIPRASHPEGPYLVSVLSPIKLNELISEHYLYQDLSNKSITPDLDYAWVAAFQNQAGRVDFWSPDSFKQFMLDLRGAIEIVAAGYGNVRPALATWISGKP